MARIIVVDDEDAYRSLIGAILRKAGHEVAAFADAACAIAHLDGHGADAFVTDLVMPGKEGIETIRDLKRRWPDLPVVAISGGGATRATAITDVLRFAEALGAARVLRKPFRAEALIAALAEILPGGAGRNAPLKIAG